MIHLMGIYQQKGDEPGANNSGNNEATNNLFRFARRDSLLGIGGTITSSSSIKGTGHATTVNEHVPFTEGPERSASSNPQEQYQMAVAATMHQLQFKQQHLQQQHASFDEEHLMEHYLIQQQQKHHEHQKMLQLAWMNLSTNRFPIRRDTLGHLHNGGW